MSISDAHDRLRLDALTAFHILDTPPEPIFDRLVEVAAHICKTPIATITLVDANRQWFKAEVGLGIKQTAREIAFCAHTIERTRFWQVADARRDRRFRDNPLVVGPPYLRFYAGIPLISPNGYNIGALAVMDQRPRRLGEAQIAALEILAQQVMTLIELRYREHELSVALASRDTLNLQLKRQSVHLQEAQRIANIGSWEMELPSRTLLLSDQTYRIFGAARTAERVAFDLFLSSVHAVDRPSLLKVLQHSVETRAPFDFIHRIVRSGGEIRYVHERGEINVHPVRGLVLAGTVQDITEQRMAQQELELLHSSIARVKDIVMITEAAPLAEPGPRIVFVNKAFEERTGYSLDEVLGRSPRFLQGEDSQRSELDRVHNALLRKEHVSVEVINYRKDGQKFWAEIDINPVVTRDGNITHFVSVQRDVTARKETEKQIEQLAFFDPLTRLPNRRLLYDRLTHALQTGARKYSCGALHFIDLDNFKALNDTLGHDKGDQLLQQVAARLDSIVRRSNTVARLGGDEFVILLEDLSGNDGEAATQAEVVAEKVLACFNEPFHIGDVEHRCTSSIGVAMFSQVQHSAEELLKRADVAMYQAKAAGRNTIRFFDQNMQSLVNARVAIDRDLRAGLTGGHFTLDYQPQVNLDGVTVGAEALVRWNHPRRGLLYPGEFIALAEETGLIVHLGQWVLEAVCTQIATWKNEVDTQMPRVSVNVSAKQFHQPDFVAKVIGVLLDKGVSPSVLKLELTESCLVDQPDDTIEKMGVLKSHGLCFSLDDFGTGYSSLSYLKRLPLDEVKIDKSFVRDILTNPDDAAIAQTIVSLGQILGLNVVAEGVETEEQRDALAKYGCTIYQGYLISPPVPPARLFR
jgi:diguanylate cyclase (GGDEF)-like protein/PAS domain S-box-containing protein